MTTAEQCRSEHSSKKLSTKGWQWHVSM